MDRCEQKKEHKKSSKVKKRSRKSKSKRSSRKSKRERVKVSEIREKSINQDAIKSPNQGNKEQVFSRTETTIDVIRTVTENEMAQGTPPPEGVTGSETEATILDDEFDEEKKQLKDVIPALLKGYLIVTERAGNKPLSAKENNVGVEAKKDENGKKNNKATESKKRISKQSSVKSEKTLLKELQKIGSEITEDRRDSKKRRKERKRSKKRKSNKEQFQASNVREDSMNENAFKTPNPRDPGGGVSRTEKTIDSVGYATNESELAIRTPQPEGATGSETEATISKDDSPKAKEISALFAGDKSANLPPEEKKPSISDRSVQSDHLNRTPRHDDNDADITKVKENKESNQEKKRSKREKLKRSSRKSKRERRKTSKEREKSINEQAIRTPNPRTKTDPSRTEMTISGVGNTLKEIELALRTPPRVATNAVGQKQQKRTANGSGSKRNSTSDRSVRSDREMRTPTKENQIETSMTERDIDDYLNEDANIPTQVLTAQPSLVANEFQPKRFKSTSSLNCEGLCKILMISLIFLVILAYVFITCYQLWLVANAFTAMYDVSIDDCQVANGLCHKYGTCCFSQCGSSRFKVFLSKLIG